jgi:hypothetical protein
MRALLNYIKREQKGHKMKKISVELIICFIMGAAGFILAGVMFASMPDTISLGLGGGARTGPKGLIFILPALVIAIPGLMFVSNKINPNRISNKSPKARMIVSICIAVLMLVLECLAIFLPRQGA